MTHLITDKLSHWLTIGVKMLPNVGVAILIVIAFYFLARLGRYGVRKINKHTAGDSAIMRLLSNIVYTIILLLGLFAALSAVQLDKTVTSLLAGAGIIGLALGFAFQDTAANILAGVLLALRRPIEIGDMIKSNDQMGIVYELNLRTTILRNFHGQAVYLPNKNVLYGTIENYSKFGERRLDLGVRVSYGEDLGKVKEISINAIKEIENVDESKDIQVWFEEFGESSINFTIAVWMKNVNQASYRTFKSDSVMAIKKAFDQNDILIPFPIRTLDFAVKRGEKLSEMKMRVENVNDTGNKKEMKVGA